MKYTLLEVIVNKVVAGYTVLHGMRAVAFFSKRADAVAFMRNN